MKVDLKKIERLSKIRIKANIKNKIQEEFIKILNFADSIKNYKLKNDFILLTSINNLNNVLREDKHQDNFIFFNRKIVFDNIPSRQEQFVKVPKILKAK